MGAIRDVHEEVDQARATNLQCSQRDSFSNNLHRIYRQLEVRCRRFPESSDLLIETLPDSLRCLRDPPGAYHDPLLRL